MEHQLLYDWMRRAFHKTSVRLAKTSEHHWARSKLYNKLLHLLGFFKDLEQERRSVGSTRLLWLWHVIGTLPAWRDYPPVGRRPSNWHQNDGAVRENNSFSLGMLTAVVFSFSIGTIK